jgi:hypothetical protein
MGPASMWGDDRAEAPGCRFECDERYKTNERGRWRGARRAAELETDLTMRDRALLADGLVNMRGVDGRRDTERQRYRCDQDARHPMRAQSQTVTQHAHEASPSALGPQTSALRSESRRPIPERLPDFSCAVAGPLRASSLLNWTGRPYHSAHRIELMPPGTFELRNRTGSVSQGLLNSLHAKVPHLTDADGLVAWGHEECA